MNELFENTKSGAHFSEDRKYRYALWRIWDESKPLVMFIGLNPSTANESDNDPTIRRVISIAKHNGFGGVYMMNCFPLVSTNPDVLDEFYNTKQHESEDLQNMNFLLQTAKRCKEIVFAWGNFEVVKTRAEGISGYFKQAKALHINKNGSPKHPLYCKTETKFVEFTQKQQTSHD
ncbi:MAG: DUF1643 domain-containing protein [Bacteroidetes bacterium]|nr:DUF1643 domain-containing protein [Bacteroidota bacterium]